MKGLIYRELYLSRKAIILSLLIYVMMMTMMSLVFISTYAGNLAGTGFGAEIMGQIYPTAYLFVSFAAVLGLMYGHNEIIDKDYKSRWQLYSYTLPVSEKKIAASKFIVRGILIATGLVLAVLSEVILSAAAKKSVNTEHLKNIFLLVMVMSLFIIETPLILRYKTGMKAGSVLVGVLAPAFAGMGYGIYKFVRFCLKRGRELYPDLDADKAIMKVAMSYVTKWRDTAMYIMPVLCVAALVGCYFWTVRELKRRRY